MYSSSTAASDSGRSTARGTDITFVAVANQARVSRQFLYDNDSLRAEIQQLRTTLAHRTQARTAREQASYDSLPTRLRAALGANQHQREENTRLRDELAHALSRAACARPGRI